MSRVSVITGGAGGMGLATAKRVGAGPQADAQAQADVVVLADVRQDRLDAATAALTALGVAVTAVHCDVTDPAAVDHVFGTASDAGTITSVIHAAGVSPSMGEAEYILRTNALGTLHVGEAFFAHAGRGAALVNVASMAAHLLPAELIPVATFPSAFTDTARFTAELLAACDIAGAEARSGIAYAISKSFVRWYSMSQAERFTARGLRIVSVSPGSTDTEMGRLEEQAGAGALVADAAVPRWATAEEMAELFAFCAGDRAGYLTGTDILNDGGVVASVTERARVAATGS